MKFFWHQHPLDFGTLLSSSDFSCEVCKNRVSRGYICRHPCHKAWHKKCITSPSQIDHPGHPRHRLKLLTNGVPSYTDGKCHFCLKDYSGFTYHCSICNFNVDRECALKPPPLTIDNRKGHEHTLALMAREVSFLCNACGTTGQRNPYVCIPCSFMFHEECITLPHVIHINRHDHRISHTYSLRDGDWLCGVCRKIIDWRYGAYSCSLCLKYAVHSKCATRDDVWDGIELEGEPEETEDIMPFKVVGDKVIVHFSHEEHYLRLIEDGITRDAIIRCEGCVNPIYSSKFYSCMECNYLLHETCGNRLRKIRHGLQTNRLSLLTGEMDGLPTFTCSACDEKSSGFRYRYQDTRIDLRCSSISWLCHHESHDHPLILTSVQGDICGACDKYMPYVLRCVKCELYCLDYKCATLPRKLKHKCDDHFLMLCYGEKDPAIYWCEICEKVTNPKLWFYKCNECGVVCHIHCVLGDYSNVKPGLRYNEDYMNLEVAPTSDYAHGIQRKINAPNLEVVVNDRIFRPYCYICGLRCKPPFVLKIDLVITRKFTCSRVCFSRFIYVFLHNMMQVW